MLWYEKYVQDVLVTPDFADLQEYDMKVIRAEYKPGEFAWRLIGAHHLTPLENMSNRNAYIIAVDKNGKRVKPAWAGWTWEGIQKHERANPVPLDKPDNEMSGNISIGSNQKVSLWMKGKNRDSQDPSDQVIGVRTTHPDEPLPDGRLFNTLGHHSFLFVFEYTDVLPYTEIPNPNDTQELPRPPEVPKPPVTDPKPPTTPVETDWLRHLNPGEQWLVNECKFDPHGVHERLIKKLTRILNGEIK